MKLLSREKIYVLSHVSRFQCCDSLMKPVYCRLEFFIKVLKNPRKHNNRIKIKNKRRHSKSMTSEIKQILLKTIQCKAVYKINSSSHQQLFPRKKKWFGTPSQSSFGDRRKQLRKHEQKQE